MRRNRKDLRHFDLSFTEYVSSSDIVSPDYSHFASGIAPFMRGITSYLSSECFKIYSKKEIKDKFELIDILDFSSIEENSESLFLVDTSSICNNTLTSEEELILFFEKIILILKKDNVEKILNKTFFLVPTFQNFIMDIAKIRALRVVFSYLLHHFTLNQDPARLFISLTENSSKENAFFVSTAAMAQGIIAQNSDDIKDLQIMFSNFRLLETIDPLGGSYSLERETSQLIFQVLKKII